MKIAIAVNVRWRRLIERSKLAVAIEVDADVVEHSPLRDTVGFGERAMSKGLRRRVAYEGVLIEIQRFDTQWLAATVHQKDMV